VSTRTPSQSKRRAEGSVEDAEAEAEQLNLRLLVVEVDILRALTVKEDGEVLCFSYSLLCLRRLISVVVFG